MKKKLLSVLLSLALVFTALPFTHIHTYAEECLDGAHAFGDWVVETAPTCEADGTQIRTCSVCGLVENEDVVATGHKMQYSSRVRATCKESGHIENICKNEGCSHTEQLVLEPNGHHEYVADCDTPEPCETIIEATEEQFGIKKGYCHVCQKDVYEAIQKVGVEVGTLSCLQSPHKYEEVVLTDSTGHKYIVKYCKWCKDYGAVSIEPCEEHTFSDWVKTCPANIKFRNCKFCGYEETAELDMTEHSLEVISHSEATCDVEGYTNYTCTYCGKDFSVVAPPKGHTFEILETVESTCFEHGFQELHCTVCGFLTQSDPFPLDDSKHEYSYEITKKATCLEDGEGTYTCKYCGYSFTKVLTSGEHNWTYWETIEDATCTTDGYECRECVTCGKTETSVLSQKGHKEVWTYMKESTCCEDGYKEGYCERCGIHLEEVWYSPNIQHKIEWYVEKPATCNQEGVLAGVCEWCSGYYTKVIPIDENAHDFNEMCVAEEPTCSHEGKATYTCQNCNITKEGSIPIDETNHTWQIWQTRVEPDCATEGIEYRYCMGCFIEEEREIPPTGEHMPTFIVEKTDNCENGIDMYEVCECCGHEEYIGTRFPERHIFDDWIIIKNPQAGVKGEKTRTCTVCGHVETVEISALADIDGDGTVTKDDYNYVLDAVNLNSKLTDDEKLVADVNGDGAVDGFDALYIDLMINNMI